jgi:nucleotide-binding universal stress UspA family protein
MTSADRIDEHGRADRDRPLLICYDGSEDAKHAIKSAGALLAARPALVLTVWEPTALDSVVRSGATAGMDDLVELDRAAAEHGGRVADEGVRIAQEAGLEAHPVAVKAAGPVWQTIVETADRRHAGAIVMGSRGLTGIRSMLLGSVSNAVVHHAGRPTLVITAPATTTPGSDGGRDRGLFGSFFGTGIAEHDQRPFVGR